MMALFEAFNVAPGVTINVEKARCLYPTHKANFRCHLPTIREIIRRKQASVGWNRVRSHKLKEGPVLMMRIAGVPVLIDGWHRAMQAFRKGRTWYPAYMLTEQQVQKCALPSHWLRRYN